MGTHFSSFFFFSPISKISWNHLVTMELLFRAVEILRPMMTAHDRHNWCACQTAHPSAALYHGMARCITFHIVFQWGFPSTVSLSLSLARSLVLCYAFSLFLFFWSASTTGCSYCCCIAVEGVVTDWRELNESDSLFVPFLYYYRLYFILSARHHSTVQF